MKNMVLFSIAMLIGLAISAQQIVSSGGESQSTSGVQLSWTLGEPIIETFSSGSTILTQGFHQTKLSATPVTDLLYPELELNVFPNPTRDFVIIQFKELLSNTRYSVFNLAGEMLETKIVTEKETRLNLKGYPNGVYILKLYDSNQQTIQNFRIVKSE